MYSKLEDIFACEYLVQYIITVVKGWASKQQSVAKSYLNRKATRAHGKQPEPMESDESPWNVTRDHRGVNV